MTRALLLNWFDLPSDAQAAFDGWHNREHVIERLSVPGFVQGRRLESLDRPAPKGHGYLVIYDADDVQVFASAAYGARLDGPTPLTQQVVPHLRDLTRTVCEVVDERGGGTGAFLRTIRLSGLGDSLAQAGASLAADLEAAHACDSVTSVQLCRPDAEVTHFKDRTQEGRATQTLRRDEYPWAVVVEACRPAALDAATSALKDCFSRRWPDADVSFLCHSYQLVFTMDKQQAMSASPGRT